LKLGAAAPAIGVIGAGFSAASAAGSVAAGTTTAAAATGGVVAGAAASTAATAAGAAGVTGVVTGGATVPAMTAMAAMGPVGWAGIAMLGADTDGLSWDCWKPVLHDESATPSSGKPMKEVVSDPRVKKITVDDGKLTLVNVWDEKFQVTYFDIPGFGIAAHADKLEE